MVIFFSFNPKGREGRNVSIFKIKPDELTASSSLLWTISEGKRRYKNTTVINIP
jgi:hypothetical protein